MRSQGAAERGWDHERMDLEQIGREIVARLAPDAAPEMGTWLLLALAVALAAVVLPPLWRPTRLAEIGRAHV